VRVFWEFAESGFPGSHSRGSYSEATMGPSIVITHHLEAIKDRWELYWGEKRTGFAEVYFSVPEIACVEYPFYCQADFTHESLVFCLFVF
jgi:hypothetical protein